MTALSDATSTTTFRGGAGAQASVAGGRDTATATEDRKGKTGNSCAAGAGAKDHVYRLIPSGSGTLDVSVQGSGALDPVAYIRTGCDKEDTQVDCAPQNVKKLTSLSLKVITGTEYFLVIDGVSGSTGPYAATVKLTTGAFCGDGKVDLNEACDDINKVDKDGCSPDCRRVDGNPASAGTCPGQPVDVWPSQTVTGAGSTTSYPNTWPYPTPSCSTTGGTLADSDHLYAVKPHASGSLVVAITTLAGGPNLMLSSRTNCDVATSSCANATGAAGAETLTVPVTNGNVVYVGVGGGGATNNKGDYNISFKLQ